MSDLNSTTAEKLREQYPRFVYEAFSYEHSDDDLKLRFRFTADPDINFNPQITITSIDRSRIDSLDPEVLRRLVFHLGLIEMLSYWKATCSPEIVIKAGNLNADQVAWWKELLLRGMGEFFYVNQIDFRSPDFVNISVDSNPVEFGYYSGALSPRTLVMTSGGKDSALTLQLVQEAAEPFTCLMLNPLRAALALATEAGCGSPIVVNRSIDPRLLELNRRGFLNGHTPFSALLSFLGVACAVLFNYEKVIVSNEHSSNESNVEFLGTQINHQYSKTFEFEQQFRNYSRKYLASGVDYFSLLRPLYEIQIIRLIAKHPPLLAIFKSCNRNQTEGTWCGRCAKCVSVFTLFYPFLEKSELIETFGGDFFEQEGSVSLLRQLAGADGHKPFECVGTHDETIAALHLSVLKARKAGKGLPLALQFAEREILPNHPEATTLAEKVLGAWSTEHNLPEEYARLLRHRLS